MPVVQITVPTHNKNTPDKHFSHNKHTLFALTKIRLFWEGEDFGKIKPVFFSKLNRLRLIFIIFEKLINTGLNLRFFRQLFGKYQSLYDIDYTLDAKSSTFQIKHIFQNKHTFLASRNILL